MNPEGSKDPSLSEYISRARVLAGQLENQTSLSGNGYATTSGKLSDNATATVVWNDAFKNGNPQVDATINIAPRPAERRADPEPPPPPPAPTEPPTEPPTDPPTEPPQLLGALAIFVGDETHGIYSANATALPTATYLADEEILSRNVLELIQEGKARLGVVNVDAVSSTQTVHPIPPYVLEYRATRLSNVAVATDQYLNALELFLDGTSPRGPNAINRAFFILDNSGSMLLTSVQPEVLDYLRSRGIENIIVEGTSTERWISFFNQYFGFS